VSTAPLVQYIHVLYDDLYGRNIYATCLEAILGDRDARFIFHEHHVANSDRLKNGRYEEYVIVFFTLLICSDVCCIYVCFLVGAQKIFFPGTCRRQRRTNVH
jgi:hypothetical protein